MPSSLSRDSASPAPACESSTTWYNGRSASRRPSTAARSSAARVGASSRRIWRSNTAPIARGIPMFATGCVLSASKSLSNELEPCASHSLVSSSSASGLPLPARRIRGTGTAAISRCAFATTAATSCSAAVVAKAQREIAAVPVPRILLAGNGNPLALELLTKEWLAHGSSSLLSDLEALNTQPAANIGIPRAIGAVFDRQIRRLDAPTRAALDLAAVLGRRLADLPLYEVVELSPAAAGEALSRLRDEGVLREVQGGLEFRNELIRAQAYYAVAGPARRHLHRSVGEVLDQYSDANRRATKLEVAWHLLRGGDRARAVSSAIDGAEAAISSGGFLEAERILTVLLREPCQEDDGQRLRLLLARALVGQSRADD